MAKRVYQKSEHSSGDWIKKATSQHKGAFRRQAQARGESTAALAAEVKANPEDFSPTTRKRAALARTLARLRR